MNFIVSACTDIGLRKKANQDSLLVKVAKTNRGRVVFAILCDGMGGWTKGELASATVIRAFDKWFMDTFSNPNLEQLNLNIIKEQWIRIMKEQDLAIKDYGMLHGTKLGTTAVIFLIVDDAYYILNVGDSRAYFLDKNIKQITRDHSLVAREIANGNLTEEEARIDKRQNILLQCIGGSKEVKPDFFTGEVKMNTMFLMCSDGFRHKVYDEEMFERLQPNCVRNAEDLKCGMLELIETNKKRGEKDNISALAIKIIAES